MSRRYSRRFRRLQAGLKFPVGKNATFALLLLLVACEEPLEERFLALSERFNPAGGEVSRAIMSCTFRRAMSEMGHERLESYVVLMEAREQTDSNIDEEVRLILQVRKILQNCAAEILARQLQAN